MKTLRKFNEYFYSEGEEMMEKPDTDMKNQLSKEEMKDLEDLSRGKNFEVRVGDYTVTKPSELDGGYVITDSKGKTMQIRPDQVEKKSKSVDVDVELAVLDVLTGKKMFESRRHRASKRNRV